MTRAIAVIVVAVLCAAVAGVDVSLSAAQDDAARQAARQQAILPAARRALHRVRVWRFDAEPQRRQEVGA